MKKAKDMKLVPYGTVPPGFEAIYAEKQSPSPQDPTDGQGKAIDKWSTWTWTFPGEESDWGSGIKHINAMQTALGALDDETRKIRAHIGSMVPCDSGFPVFVDEILAAIGTGTLPEKPFRDGCFMGGGFYETRCSQPRHTESMQTIRTILKGYMSGERKEEFTSRFPYASGFIMRTYQWLGAVSALSELQKLLLERMLLTLEAFSRRSCTGSVVPTDESITETASFEMYEQCVSECFSDGGRGAQLDAKISKVADLPEIPRLRYDLYDKNVQKISDARKRDLYKVCTQIAYVVYELSDCHHNTFRVIENQIHGIATGKPDMPYRNRGAERSRMARTLFGYALGLDKWLLKVPMPFLLLDIGHLDLGFDPKNEILRVYALLGEERTPVKEWLVACLWYNLAHNRQGGLCGHPRFLEEVQEKQVSCRIWMDSQLKEDR
jgi:hypothetical protein